MTNIKQFPPNTVGKDYVVGDIHGCFTRLLLALDAIHFNSAQDRLFSVGDLVDRGPESHLVLDWIAKPWFHAVRGNHEDMLINWFNKDYSSYSPYDYHSNGGDWFIYPKLGHTKDFSGTFEFQEAIATALACLPIAIQVPVGNYTVGIIHAGSPTNDWLDLNAPLNAQKLEFALWDRSCLQYKDKSLIKNIDLVIVGHTPLLEVQKFGNTLFIDSGAYQGKPFKVLEIAKLL